MSNSDSVNHLEWGWHNDSPVMHSCFTDVAYLWDSFGNGLVFVDDVWD